MRDPAAPPLPPPQTPPASDRALGPPGSAADGRAGLGASRARPPSGSGSTGSEERGTLGPPSTEDRRRQEQLPGRGARPPQAGLRGRGARSPPRRGPAGRGRPLGPAERARTSGVPRPRPTHRPVGPPSPPPSAMVSDVVDLLIALVALGLSAVAVRTNQRRLKLREREHRRGVRSLVLLGIRVEAGHHKFWRGDWDDPTYLSVPGLGVELSNPSEKPVRLVSLVGKTPLGEVRFPLGPGGGRRRAGVGPRPLVPRGPDRRPDRRAPSPGRPPGPPPPPRGRRHRQPVRARGDRGRPT